MTIFDAVPGSSGRLKLNRWMLAALVDARLPQVRGRDRLLRLVRGDTVPKRLRGPVRVCWGPGLEATVDPSADGSLQQLYMAQWVQPALIPVLEAALQPGALFVDVGANIGVYATWAGRLVGRAGLVIALEPVPETRRWLDELCGQNALEQIDVRVLAAGAQRGTARMHTIDGASGLSRVVSASTGGITVDITPLDDLLGSRTPALMKIDVEGHELAVLEGSRRTLERTGAPVVFEAPDFGGGSGSLDCVQLLGSIGYQVFSLTPRGLRAFDAVSFSHNLLAVRDNQELLDRLRTTRFPRSQNL
jgi:FkbM family methyltransferase